ncbi:acyltransferase family protein [Streptomyces sclerotialus]|uniref:acyltransferase family protein n=1 Tax=Streptomyces sclerotialus TaxID=1957 RepID=UPI0018CA63D2
MRFVAAFGVFVCHVATLEAARKGSWSAPAFFLLGPVGVSLFFVLSGFVLTCSARETDTARSFWRRRIVKIYPSHLVVWVLIMLLFRGMGMPRPVTDAVVAPTVLGDVANALLVHTLIPLPQFGLAGNGVAWSLTCELLFYLLFPLLLPLVRRVRTGWLPVAAGAATVAAWAVPMVSLGLGGPPFEQSSLPGDVTQPQLLFVYMFPPSRLPEFVLGMILARMHLSGFPVRIGVLPAAGLLCAALFLGIALLPAPFLLTAATVVPVALLVRATAAVDVRGGRSLLREPGMVFLGNLSYAFYLVHATVIAVVLFYGGGAWGTGRVACVSFIVALAVSWLLYSRVERPCMRRFSAARPRPRTTAALPPVLPGTDYEGAPVRNPSPRPTADP